MKPGSAEKNWKTFLLTSFAAVLITGCARQVGEATGKVAAAAVDETVVAKTALPVKVFSVDKGGSFCGVTAAMGAPVYLDPGYSMPRNVEIFIAGVNEHGAKHCGWRPSK